MLKKEAHKTVENQTFSAENRVVFPLFGDRITRRSKISEYKKEK